MRCEKGRAEGIRLVLVLMLFALISPLQLKSRDMFGSCRLSISGPAKGSEKRLEGLSLHISSLNPQQKHQIGFAFSSETPHHEIEW